MKTETILMVLVAFIIGWFLKTMIHGGLIEGQEDPCSIDDFRNNYSNDYKLQCISEATTYLNNPKQCIGHASPETVQGILDYCENESKISFPNKIDPKSFLNKLKTAYNEGENGVLVSVILPKNRTYEYFNFKDPPTIDSSGSIIKKDTNAGIYTVRGKNFLFGYIWDPDININIVQCAYTTASDTNSRLSNFNDKCGRNLEAQSDKNHKRDKAIKLSAPIMCGGKASSKIKCNKSSYCFTQDENAKSYPNCNDDGECDEPLCDNNENCIQCMLRQGKEQQGEYSNFHYVHCPNCTWNEVVLDRYGREKLYTERYQKNDKNQPSAIFIGIDNKFPYTNSVDCEEIFKMSSSQTESTPNALFKYIQKYFSEDTIVILFQYQDMWNDLNFKNIEFLNGYKVRDIYDISNDKSPLCSNNGN
jgi:hypothetical protein